MSNTNHNANVEKSKNKKGVLSTILAVLFFPITLTCLIWKSKLSTWLKITLILILWVVVFTAGGSDGIIKEMTTIEAPKTTISVSEEQKEQKEKEQEEETAESVSDSEREVFYKYFEFYWNLPTVPIGDKSRHNKAISLTAEEFNISTDEAEKIYEKVSKAKPTEKEIEIYEAFEKGLDETIENDSPSKPFKEDAVKKEIAEKYNITTTKLDTIVVLLLSDTEYQKQREIRVAQETKEKQAKAIIEKRKEILDTYIKALDSIGMNQFLESVAYKYDNVDECSIVIRVRNTWHYQLKQIRLQVAQSLWNLWAQSYYLEDEKDKCRMDLVDLNGNNVGGSSWLGGSIIRVID